ncbi:5-aminopentanamidase [Psychrobacter sp. JCM 18901]|uniref:nitrilase-related carbon-nitrogen hydrolase n=1 Tax=Psychrobacter sp. JCM 18901 TaxID=1298609 RepID=UPI000432DBDC|nr:nitrilase-related carbon-nitrogen hydrolase [Psychrobacter sp. JCM 18901]GAF56682.1 5-aminopentanamidase [Psychrobacter sp. JCM 18901]
MQIILNQMDITDYQVSVNAAAILKSIHDNQACDGFMIFPELALTGFPTLDNIEALYHQSTEHFHSILEASKNTDSTIIIGHIDKQDQLFYNACSFIKNGKIIHKHRKVKALA